MLPYAMCPSLHLTDLTNGLECILDVHLHRTLALPCHVAMLGFLTYLHSAHGGTVMPAAW